MRPRATCRSNGLPFMTERKYRRGDTLFKLGDPAHEMLLTVTGKFLVKEINVEIGPGALMGSSAS